MKLRRTKHQPPPHGPARPRCCARAGFSLVEVTLALMVVAVGILSVMSLFPAGLDQNARSIADTRMALFAEDVFNGLHAIAAEDWDGLNTNEIPVAASMLWKYNDIADPTNRVDYAKFAIAINWPDVYTNIYYLDTPDAIEKYALRYSMGIQTNTNSAIKGVTLWVWSGEFGSTRNPTIFYSEFFNPRAGGLP